MFGDHIARAMTLEHQRDLVPDLRRLEDQRNARGEDAQSSGAETYPLSEQRNLSDRHAQPDRGARVRNVARSAADTASRR